MWRWRIFVLSALVLTGWAFGSGYEAIAYVTLAVVLAATV